MKPRQAIANDRFLPKQAAAFAPAFMRTAALAYCHGNGSGVFHPGEASA